MPNNCKSKSPKLEKPLKTEQDVALWVINRHMREINKQVGKFRRRFNNLLKGKLPKEYLGDEDYTEGELLSEAAGEIETDLLLYKERLADLRFIQQCNLLPYHKWEEFYFNWNNLLTKIMELADKIEDYRCSIMRKHLGKRYER